MEVTKRFGRQSWRRRRDAHTHAPHAIIQQRWWECWRWWRRSDEQNLSESGWQAEEETHTTDNNSQNKHQQAKLKERKKLSTEMQSKSRRERREQLKTECRRRRRCCCVAGDDCRSQNWATIVCPSIGRSVEWSIDNRNFELSTRRSKLVWWSLFTNKMMTENTGEPSTEWKREKTAERCSACVCCVWEEKVKVEESRQERRHKWRKQMTDDPFQSILGSSIDRMCVFVCVCGDLLMSVLVMHRKKEEEWWWWAVFVCVDSPNKKKKREG